MVLYCNTTSADELSSIVSHLQAGGVIAYPTEGVWGLGCLPDDEAAVYCVLSLKARPVEAGLILVAGQVSQVDAYLSEVTQDQRRLLMSRWPGPVTFLIPDEKIAPVWIRGQHNSVAIRVSTHPTIVDLCDAVGPIVSTSANPRGENPARTIQEAEAYFGDNILYVLGETAGLGKPSQIIDLRTGEEIRR